MTLNVFILLIEYSAIPIALMLYSIAIKALSTADPIKIENQEESIWDYGIELMVIISVSTLLFGISYLGHADGLNLSHHEFLCVIASLLLSIIEFFILVFTVFMVKKWGKKAKQTRRIPNLIAAGFLVILWALIIICKGKFHTNGTGTEPEKNDNQLHIPVWVVVVTAVLLTIAGFLYVRFMIRRAKRKLLEEYNIGARSSANNPEMSIASLKKSLRNLPDDSPLQIDIRMKLASINFKLKRFQFTINEIALLEKLRIFKKLNSYLRDSILKMKFNAQLKIARYKDAEKTIGEVRDTDTAAALETELANARKGNDPPAE